LNGYMFYGGTLWTDFDKGDGPGDEATMRYVQGLMNDFRGVKNTSRMTTFNVPIMKTNEQGEDVQVGVTKHERPSSFSPGDAYEDHQAFLKGLTETMELHPDKSFIVCGHHAPSKQSTHPRYAHQTTINTAYSSDLVPYITANQPQIKVWTHGHTHEPFDYMVGTTRVICNPRGYIGCEERASWFALKFFEV
jgi:hypothetical protein